MNDNDIERQSEGLLDHSVDSDAYWLAVDKIRTAGVAFGWDYILRQCKSSNPEMRLRAVDVLAQMKGRDETETVAVLLQVLTTENNARVIRSCIHALGHQYYHKNSFYTAIEKFADFDSVDVRHAVACALPNSNSTNEAVELLMKLMTDEDADVRDWATFGLGAMMDEDSQAIRDALAERLDDTDFDTQFEAIYGLARRKDMRALAPLLLHIEGGWWSDLADDCVVKLLEIDTLPDDWDLARISEELRKLQNTILA